MPSNYSGLMPEYLNKKPPEQVEAERAKQVANQINAQSNLIKSLTNLKKSVEGAQEAQVFDDLFYQEGYEGMDQDYEPLDPRAYTPMEPRTFEKEPEYETLLELLKRGR